ncbi:MAG: Do family serine endopeptidase [Pirellulaceae bacterium]|nr:Do family serine endopeptidase [Pirellulaceae bacterium]
MKSPNKKWIANSVVATTVALAVTIGAWAVADQSKPAPLANLSPQQKQAIESANHLSEAFRAVASELLPSVVAIENRPTVALTSDSRAHPSNDDVGENPFKGTPFEDMFRDHNFRTPRGMQPGDRSPGRRVPAPHGGIGSGVIIDAAGIILTNNHVVAGGGEVTVRTHDGREFVATNVWTDPKTDIAVVKIDGASDLVAATLGNSDDVAIGDWVIALGQPFGLESTVTAGIISAKHRGIGITARENFLQTDAAINPGNSGGPLVNLRGEVVGINTAIHSRSGGNVGIGFAIPSNLARWVGDQLVGTGSVRRAYLGVGIQPVTQDLAKELSVKPRGGVVVTDVYPNTPANKAGLQSGDVIVRFGEKEITSPQALQLAVERSPIGKVLMIDVVRDGKSLQLKYEGALQTPDFATKMDGDIAPSTKQLDHLGLEIAPIDGDVAKQLGIDDVQGVVITAVAKNSSAAKAGLSTGMVITEVDRVKISSVDEFDTAIKRHQSKSQDNGLLLLVRSSQGSRFVVVKP